MDTQLGLSLPCLAKGAEWGASDLSTLCSGRGARDHFQLQSAVVMAPKRRSRRQVSTYTITPDKLYSLPLFWNLST